jgi:hypothetical protein
MSERRLETVELVGGGVQVVEVLAEFKHPIQKVNRQSAEDFCKSLTNVEYRYERRVRIKTGQESPKAQGA